MLLTSWLNAARPSRSGRRLRPRRLAGAERLEDRTVLAASVVTIGVTADGYATNTDFDPDFETLDTAGQTLPGRRSNSSPRVEDRPLLEFDLRGIGTNQIVSRATLALDVSSYVSYVSSGGGLPEYRVRGYVGDGSVGLADASAAIRSIGGFEVNDLGRIEIDLDPAFLNDRRGGFAGLQLYNDWPNSSWAAFVASEGAFGSFSAPSLTLELQGPPGLSVWLGASEVKETAGTVSGSVTRTGDLSHDLTVMLHSFDETELTVPASVTIAAGQATANFTATVVDDALPDGAQGVGVTASAVVGRSLVYDTTFAADGAAETPLRHVTASRAALLIQPDGKLIVAGDSIVGGTGSETFSVMRFNPDGSVDSTFGTNGVASAAVGPARSVSVYELFLAADGKILLLGNAQGGSLTWADIVAVRFNADGSLDGTYGVGGVARHESHRNYYAQHGVLLPDGKLLATLNIDGSGTTLRLVRLNANGSLDTTFGTGGIVDTGIDGSPHGLAVDAQGRIYSSNYPFSSAARLFRMMANGAIDTTFGTGGAVTLPSARPVGSIELLSDGKIQLLQGSEVLRLLPDGTLDSSFGGGDGIASPPVTNFVAHQVAVLADGSLLAAGRVQYAFAEAEAAFVRYLADGTLDPLFGRGGLQTITDTADRYEYIGRFAEDAQGKIVSFGRIGAASDFAVLRHTLSETTVSRLTALTVMDDDGLELTAPPVTVGGTVTAILSRGVAGDSPVVARFTSYDPELVLPKTVVIPAGEASVTFEIRAADNGRPDGSRLVYVTVNADGYVSEPAKIAVVEPRTVSLDVSADGTVTDLNRDGSWESADASTTSIGILIEDDPEGSKREQRGVFEFDVTSASAPHGWHDASLTLQAFWAGYRVGGGGFTLTVYAYAGDGLVSTADALRTGLKVGELFIPEEEVRADRRTIVLDAAAVEELTRANRYVGFLTVITGSPGSAFGPHSSDVDYVDPSAKPRLNFVPNSPPTAVADAQAIGERDRIAGGVLDNDTDPDGDALFVVEVNGDAANVGQGITLASGATVRMEILGAYTYDPHGAFVRLRRGETATDTFTYTVSDGHGGTSTATVTITIHGGGEEADLVGFLGGNWWVGVSDATKFTTTLWSRGPNSPFDSLGHADFTGDGKSDVFTLLDGAWAVGTNTGGAFTFGSWGRWANADWQDVKTGDLNFDGKADILARLGGRWWAALSNGTSFEAPKLWATWAVLPWREFFLADVSGDGKADLVGYDRGRWWVGVSNGTAFDAPKLSAVWANRPWQKLLVLKANGDFKADVAGFLNGEWWVGWTDFSQNFVTTRWARWANLRYTDLLAGDFDGDGRDDVVGRSGGNWWLSVSTGVTLLPPRLYAAWSNVAWKDVRSADFDGDGRDDLAGRYNGQWWVAQSEGAGAATRLWGGWSEAAWKGVGAAELSDPAVEATGSGSASSSAASASAASAAALFTAADDDEPLSLFWSKSERDKEFAGRLLATA